VYFYIDLLSTLTSGAGPAQANGDFGDQCKSEGPAEPAGAESAPNLAPGTKDRAEYLAIGESDRMTLKFTKPTIETQAH
jgi:predicted methyltransferase